jgi:glycolate oxidase FAD binding subunit
MPHRIDAAALLGAAGEEALLPAASAAAFGADPASLVLAPSSAEAVARVLGYCSRVGQPVRAAGAGTWLAGAAPLPRQTAAAGQRPPPEASAGGAPPVVVSTARLAAVHEYEPADLTVGVGAGVSLAALRARLAEHRQWLALDPPAAAGATIGATLSLSAAGPLRHAFGTPRDAVLGLEVATGDGRLLRFGGRVVKNVAGYDVVRLLVGSRGALGVITAAWVRLRPLPDHDKTWLLPRAEPDPAEVEAIARAIEPAALEWAFGGLLVRVMGNAALLDAAAASLDARTGARRLGAGEAARTWARLAGAEAGAALIARLYARPASLAALLPAARRLARALERVAPVTLAAHATEGVVRVIAGHAADWTDVTAPLSAARTTARALGGGARFEPLPAALASLGAFDGGEAGARADGGDEAAGEAEAARAAGAERRIVAAIRAHFDPAGILR